MAKNAMLAKIYAAAEQKYLELFHRKMDMLLQMGQDAAIIAANETLQLGPKRARDFCAAYIEAMNDMAHMMRDDQIDDPDFVYAKTKIDERIRAIVGDELFIPWEERHGQKEKG